MNVATSLFPIVQLQEISVVELNRCLDAWGHRMGPMTRPVEYGVWCHALVQDGRAIAITSAATLIRTHVGGGLAHLSRTDTVELSRLCAARRDLNRSMLRLWRELVFPVLQYPNAISYQDAAMHRGDVYRFDGWARSPRRSHSGTDHRTGAIGRDKWIWVWPPSALIAREVTP